MATDPIELDALVVGAGFSGIYATYCFDRLGLDGRCIDIAGGVGGTWYWNRYPGAMSDTHSQFYRFSWDKEDLQIYPWTHHYLYQPEILQYLNHIVDKHGLRGYMQFNTEMESAGWEEKPDGTGRWRVKCKTGDVFFVRYLVTALGLLSRPNYPDIPGLKTFAGEIVHTAQWTDDIHLEGKRVGIIGNGSTGVQVMTAIAPIVSSLTSFQRHPQYSVPSKQGPVSTSERAEINAQYEKLWEDVRSSLTGFGIQESPRRYADASPEERQKAFQRVWDQGNGFNFMFGAFCDLTVDEAANLGACEFIRTKIDETVKDPRKADILKPKDLYARRPLCDAGYYEIFNRDNVDVVDLQATPISSVTAQGIELSDGTVHELDVLILATGFDAVEGNYLRLSITGRNDKTLAQHWEQGPTAYGAIACSGFPNLFLIGGPQGPFSNLPVAIELEVELIMAIIEEAEARSKDVEAEEAAEGAWGQRCEELAKASLFRKTPSWVFGVNVEGGVQRTKFFFGGVKEYRLWRDELIGNGFEGLGFIDR